MFEEVAEEPPQRSVRAAPAHNITTRSDDLDDAFMDPSSCKLHSTLHLRKSAEILAERRGTLCAKDDSAD